MSAEGPNHTGQMPIEEGLAHVFPVELSEIAQRLAALERNGRSRAAGEKLNRMVALLTREAERRAGAPVSVQAELDLSTFEQKQTLFQDLESLLVQIEDLRRSGGESGVRVPGARGSWGVRFSTAFKRASRRKFSRFFHREPRGVRFEPTPALGLSGLALSGGGIRSATFSLGVLQVLARERVLGQVDYMSTVSGGGFMGSCLQSLLAGGNAGLDGERFPFHHGKGKPESEALKKLRAGGDYLAPNGFLDKIRIPVLLLRGIVVNLIVVAPILLVAAVLSELAFFRKLWEVRGESPGEVWHEFFLVAPWIALAFGASLLLFPALKFLAGRPVVRRWLPNTWKSRNLYARILSWIAVVVLAFLFVESLPLLIHTYQYATQEQLWPRRVVSAVITGAPFILSLMAGRASATVEKLSSRLVLYGIGILGPLFALLAYVVLTSWLVYDPGAIDERVLILIATALWIYARLFADVNATSMHGFYRDRLSRAYLFDVDEQGNVRDDSAHDRLRLSRLNTPDHPAPYPIINGTVNLQGSDDPALRGRSADFFMFTKRFIGSERTGYARTGVMEDFDRHLDLATAMAISGAAAAPNMGTHTSKPLVFIMALLNVRLGYWLPNPGLIDTPGWNLTVLRPPGADYFLLELVSRLTAKKRFVNVSDGGHIENLGIYELLRRRCRYIIACDAERDPKLQFGGLAKLVRFARTDMGVQMKFFEDHLDGIRDGSRHWAMASIDYGPGVDKGRLLYIKSSLTTDENPYIREYHDRNPEYPHESTADQFFDEEQFEAYRALGYHIGNDLFPTEGAFAAGPVSDADDPVAEWFSRLERVRQPTRHRQRWASDPGTDRR